jgi:hypothetical protein
MKHMERERERERERGILIIPTVHFSVGWIEIYIIHRWKGNWYMNCASQNSERQIMTFQD